VGLPEPRCLRETAHIEQKAGWATSPPQDRHAWYVDPYCLWLRKRKAAGQLEQLALPGPRATVPRNARRPRATDPVERFRGTL
jgi:hypothetical protein